MESVADKITHTLAFRAKVVSITEKTHREWQRGLGAEAAFTEHSLGWYIGLERSHELLYAGDTRPSINPGDEAIIRINFYAATAVPASPR